MLRVVVVPAEVCPEVTAGQVAASVDGAIGWLIAGQDDAGRYLYGWDRDEGEPNTGYNDARHAGVTMSLYQAYGQVGDENALAAADRALSLALGQMHDGPGWVAWRTTGDVQVGANSLLLAALALRRQATDDTHHDEVMRGIGRFLVSQQQADGSIFSAWSVRQGATLPTYGPFATGEAAWALVLLDRSFPGEGWADAAVRTIDYMATDRNEQEGHLTSLPDHWAAYALSDLPIDLLTDDRLDYARRLAGFFAFRLRFEAQRRGAGINLLVRWYPGPPAGVGTAGEGIGALRLLAEREPRAADMAPHIDGHLECMAGYQYQRQVLDPEAPAEEQGAWFYRGYTQMDDQQHVLSALLAALRTMEEDA